MNELDCMCQTQLSISPFDVREEGRERGNGRGHDGYSHLLLHANAPLPLHLLRVIRESLDQSRRGS